MFWAHRTIFLIPSPHARRGRTVPNNSYHLSTVELALKAVLCTRLCRKGASKNTFVRTEVWPLCHADGSQYGQTAVHGYHHVVVAEYLQDYLESNELNNEPLQSVYKRFLAAKPPSLAFTFCLKLIIVTVLNCSCCLTCLLLLTKLTTIFYLKDLTLGSQFVVLLLTGFGRTLQTAHNSP